MHIRVVRIIFVLQVLFRQREGSPAERIKERRIDLERHVYLNPTPQYSGDHSPVLHRARLLLEKRCHDDYVFQGLSKRFDLPCQRCNICIEILTHRFKHDFFGRVRQEEIGIRKKEPLLRLRFLKELLLIEALQLALIELRHIFGRRPFGNPYLDRFKPKRTRRNRARDREEILGFFEQVISCPDASIRTEDRDGDTECGAVAHHALFLEHSSSFLRRCSFRYRYEISDRKTDGWCDEKHIRDECDRAETDDDKY